ncbi:MAG: CvpA family protein [Alphaproteobacteria bacterium]|nr:CvpA family protein [Alphaproteobacteria bacterium]
MNQLPLNATDLGIIIILMVSGLLAFSRGLVKEVLAVAAWVGAALATLYGFRHAQPIARKFISVELAADAAAGVAVFVVSLIVLSMITHAISERVRDSALNAVDRSLGFVFGLVRGAVLIVLAYMLLAWAVPSADQPDWLRQARAMPFIERGADLLISLVPRDQRGESAAAADRMRRQAREADDARRSFERLLNPQPKADAPRDVPGYNPQERRTLDRLIENTK